VSASAHQADSASLALRSVSVVVPCRFEPLVGETVRTVLEVARAEGAASIEILVVGTGDWTCLPADSAIRVIEPEQPLWSGPARNRGLAEARGDLVVFLDADCQPLPGWYRGIQAAQAERPSICAGAIVSSTDNFWQACYNVCCFREYLVDLPRSSRRFLPSYCLSGPRSAFQGIGGFDESWPGAEDLDLTVRLARAGWPLWFDPAIQVLHRPASRSFERIVRHGWAHGGTSMRARRAYPEAFGMTRWSTAPVTLSTLGPLVSAYFLIRTYQQHPRFRSISLRGSLAIYLFRLAWCLGAAWSGLRPGTVFRPVANKGTSQ